MTWSDPAPDPAPRFRRLAPKVRAMMLIEAGFACLARGGITAFTVDNICLEAQASRGLIGHHFGSKDGLLAAVYAEAYRRLLERLTADGNAAPDLATLIDRALVTEGADTLGLRVWLALWGEVASNPELQAEHARHYASYRASLATAIAGLARARGKVVDAEMLAGSLIALIDGLWLELCLAPALMTPALARKACLGLIEPILGPIGGPPQAATPANVTRTRPAKGVQP